MENELDKKINQEELTRALGKTPNDKTPRCNTAFWYKLEQYVDKIWTITEL